MNVTLVLATQDSPLPSGVTFAHYEYTVTGASVIAPISTASTTVPLGEVSPGDYSAVAQAMDSTGAALGAPVSASFTVPVPAPTTFAAPATLTVTLA